MSKEVIKQAAETVNEDPSAITVKITSTRKKRFSKDVEETRVFEIKPPTLGRLIEIGKLLQDIPDFNVATMPFEDAVAFTHTIAAKYGTRFSRLIATVIAGKNDDIEEIDDLVLENVDTATMLNIWVLYLNKMNVSGFTNSIGLMRKYDVVSPSPTDQRR